MPVLLGVIAGLLLGGCGGGDVTPVGQPSEVPPSIHTTPPISAVEPGEAAVRSTVDERAEQRFALPGGPDWLAVDDDAVWVKRDEGTVDRIDPATNEITSLWVPPREEGKLGPMCQGIGAGLEGVWACTGGGIARIAPDNSEIVSTVAVQKIFDQGHIGVGHGHAWILTGDGSTLVGVSAETDTIETTIDLGTRCTDLDLSDDALWIVCLPEDLVLRVDPDRGEVTDRIEGLDRPQRISVAADVWVAYKGHLARIDPKTSTVSAAVVTAPGAVDGLFATDDRVWLRSHGRFLRTIDAETLAVMEEISAPEQSGGDVVAAFGSIWASAFDDAVVYRLRW